MSLSPVAANSSTSNQQGFLGGKGEEVTSAWKLELEQAQWAYLSKNGPPAPAIPEHEERASSSPNSDPGLTTGEQSQQMAPSPSAAQPEDGSGVVEHSSEEMRTAELATPLGDDRSPAFSALPQILELDTPSGEIPEAAPLSASPAYLPRPAWSETSVLAYTGEDGTAVWVRDASLDTDDYRKLACELRVRLAPMGQRLSSLVVNGESAMPSLEIRPNTLDDER